MSPKSFLLALLMILVVSGCNKEEEQKIVKSMVTGQVQKGPFVNGTSITMSELNTSLSQTGNVFTTQITNNKGSFQIDNISLTSSYVEFSASGYYYDEVKGEISSSPLNLLALSDIRDISTVNVNLLTHLEKQRVEYLMKQNKTFPEAKKAAQGEILGIFGISLNGITNSETLDITVNSEANAILLGISLVLQGNRSVGDMTELLANISNDLKSDGIINDASIISVLRNSAKTLNLVSIKSNLEKRFQELGITSTIPGFEKYANDFLAYTGEKPSATTQLPSDVTINAATMNATVNPNSLNTTLVFEWGKTTTYTDSIVASSSLAGSSSVNVSKNITGILPGTLYHFRVKARNSKGTTYGNDLSFITLGSLATITTKPATNIKSSRASVSAIVNPNLLNTTIVFRWGKTTSNYTDSLVAYQNPVSGNNPVTVNADLTGLTISTNYYYRAYAKNQLGTAVSEEQTFMTLDGTPIINTIDVTRISKTTVTCGGNIIDDGSFEIIARGICISTSMNPLVSDFKIEIGNGTGLFVGTIDGLSPGTRYYIRSYATNINGTFYGNQLSFVTYDINAINDIDNNYYNTVSMGSQTWMKENLKTTKYSNGDAIVSNVVNNASWIGLSTGALCYYNHNETVYKSTYGALYNWYSTNDSRNICPTGWHVPSNAEWSELGIFLGGNSIAGGKLKEAGLVHWKSPNAGATNEGGFTALPAGFRNGAGGFGGYGDTGNFWSSTDDGGTHTSYWQVYFDDSGLHQFGNPKHEGYSIRCIKD